MIPSVDISILIVNYNGEPYLKECLDSVLSHDCDSSFEIILIDNQSKDKSRDVLKEFEDRITVLYHETNVGFAMGNNIAFKKASGKFVFMLNNDTVLHGGVLDTLKNYLIDHPHVGSVSPKLLNTDGSIQNHGSSLSAYRYRANHPKKVPFVIGAAVMMTAALYKEMGGLDDHYFFYNDDIDLCKRLRLKGYEIHYVANVSVTHHLGLATKTRSIPSIIEGYRGTAFFVRKFYPYPIFLLYMMVVILLLLINSALNLIPSIWNSYSRSLVKAYTTIITLFLTNQLEAPR